MIDSASATSQDQGNIIALIPDVFFSVTVRNAIRRLSYHAHIVKSVQGLVDAAATEDAVLAVIDLSAMRDDAEWDDLGELIDRGLPVLVFGAHRDVEGLRRAKRAGVTRVVANSQFHREMHDLIGRYARHRALPDAATDPDPDDADTIGSTPPGMTDEYFHDRAMNVSLEP